MSQPDFNPDGLRCLNDGGNGMDCDGVIEYRTPLSGTGRAFPRCGKHWEVRLREDEGIRRRYPAHPPADFDPGYAGESWYEDV